MPNFNCECDAGPAYRPLSDLRTALLRRLGYSAQAANPPPGMAELLNSFLDSAHRTIYRTYPALHGERIFTWTMTPGERFYGIAGNDEGAGETPACDKVLDPHRLSWVGMEDLNGVWYPLKRGIPPEFYTRADITPGWPQYFEIRACIEVFPQPQAAYKLRVVGIADFVPMIADADKPVVDDEAVFLLALAQAKSHYSQPDSQIYYQQAYTHVQNLVGGMHGTRRYIPGQSKMPPATPPVFLPLV